MTNTVSVSKAFQRDAKHLLKKFPTLKESINQLIADLIENPYLGVSYGSDIYKIRLADPSKRVGKSGGFRILYFHLAKTEDGIQILLMTIFDKSEKSTIPKAEAIKKLKQILDEE